MAVKITYKANNFEFGKLMMAKQTQDLADQAANLGVQVARLYANGARPRPPADYIASIKAESGPPVSMGGNPRRTARVVADHRLGGAIEFGTGVKSSGSGRGAKRPQGGYSEPYRILGRTGSRIGSPPKGKAS